MSQLHTTKIAEQPDIIMMLSLLLCEQLSNFVMCHFPVTANTFAYHISHYKLVHVLLYDILVRYFGMILMKIK